MTDFLVQLVKRFLAKTPKFFKILQVLSIVLAIVTGLPSLLESAGIVLPAALSVLASKVISIASIVAAFITQLTATETAKKNAEIPSE